MVLNPREAPRGSLQDWNWGLIGEDSYYTALFPRAWTIYEEPDEDLRLVCRQISPVIPHNYRDSSLPVSVFVWTITNLHSKEAAEVSLMFTFQNGSGASSDAAGGHLHRTFQIPVPSSSASSSLSDDSEAQTKPCNFEGVEMLHRTNDEDCPLSFAIATTTGPDRQVSFCPSFETNSSGKELWQSFSYNGTLPEMFPSSSSSTASFNKWTSPSKTGTTVGGAIAVKLKVEPGKSNEIVFALTWDSPNVRLSRDSALHERYYTRFTGAFSPSPFPNREGVVASMAVEALTEWKSWEQQIEAWQNPVLKDENLPSWFKCALFNELYYLAAGGSVWISSSSSSPSLSSSGKGEASNLEEEKKEKEKATGEPLEERSKPHPPLQTDVGRFLYLEGGFQERLPLYNTYDSHFYASFALCMLWPSLELSLQREVASWVPRELSHLPFKAVHDGKLVQKRKVMGAVPHDMGSPSLQGGEEAPINAHIMHDTSRRKDLNSKFVLQVYRDFVFTGDKLFLREVWPAVRNALEYLQGRFDKDGDGMIENEGGEADQGYEGWSSEGVSAYTGGLWLAALAAATAIARTLLDEEQEGEEQEELQNLVQHYQERLDKATRVYEAKLWKAEEKGEGEEGGYYRFNETSYNNGGDSVMADQMAGQWYARACGLPTLLPPARVLAALKTVYKLNVLGHDRGKRGAINAMRPDGSIDTSCSPSSEVWPGVCFALSACMLQEGMPEECFRTAHGTYRTIYHDWGFWFQTPEAWECVGRAAGCHRALASMRGLSVWAVYWAYLLRCASFDARRIYLLSVTPGQNKKQQKKKRHDDKGKEKEQEKEKQKEEEEEEEEEEKEEHNV
ncbi:Non-lysosomal glucosylceramidase, variant 2 [Balamuthia mandrillaris]